MATKPFQIHIASIIPTSYEDARIGGLRGQYTWRVQQQKKLEKAVRYQLRVVAVRWAEVLYGSCKIAHQVHWIPDAVKRLRLIRRRGHEIVDPHPDSFCDVDGADYYFVWLPISEEVHGQLDKRQTRAHYRHRRVWVPCLEETEIKRFGLKCSRSGIEHEFRRCLVNALHSVGLTDADVDHNEVDKRRFVHKVMQLLTPSILDELSRKFPYVPGW